MLSGMDLLLEAAGRSDGIVSSSNTGVGSQSHKLKRTLSQNFEAAMAKPSLVCTSEMSFCSSMSSLPPKKRMKPNNHSASFGSMSDPFQLVSSRVSVASSISSLSRGSFNAGPSTLNMEWPAIRPRQETNYLLELCNKSVVLPKKSAGKTAWLTKTKKGRSSSSASRSAAAAGLHRQVSISSINSSSCDRRTSSSSSSLQDVKDVNGNDMCMGYFSMAPRKMLPADEEATSCSATSITSRDDSMRLEEENSKAKCQRLPHASDEKVKISDSSMSTVACPDKQLTQSHRQAHEASCAAAKKLLYESFLKALNQPQPSGVDQQSEKMKRND